MRKLRFVWIDDKIEKIEAFRAAIEAGVKGPKATAIIEPLKVEVEILDELEAWADENKRNSPDLLIVDQVYNVALPFGLSGTSIAHLLRSAFPSVPIVCVSAMLDSQSMVDQEDLAEFTAVFAYTRLERHVADLYAIARDFKFLSPAPSGDVRRHLISCLKAPKRDQSDLKRVLPDEFQNQPHSTTAHRMGRWIYHVLRRRPGFLYDRLFMATLLGLKEESFAKVEHLFLKAKYKGAFAISSDPRWWASEVRKVLFATTPPDGPDIPQLAGRTLPGIGPSDYSICYISRKIDPPPDAIAFVDVTRDAERKVVRREFTDQHPNDPGTMPGFETRLILRKRA